ncbi:hypothetical protein [Murimonas intestini]|uniref:YhhN-like protein n=2 Tax=Murimonas intestini TaxID=1337051 RepID=A0AB73SXC8_9FIRM|nr:hypothetical protein [Murimonas intestini]MCR1843457.1 hypothetical protein [Murimonas intestini]MCR1868789.1 hypothetical protein [Murimonas intestini]MCR1886251.1 hypothetical protein [Murimonas intestini]
MPSRTRLFLNAEAILYIVILINMQRAFLPLPVSPLLCLASIFLCFLYALSWLLESDIFHEGCFFLNAALLFSLCADYFLIFTDFYIAGILLFCLAQLSYFLLLKRRISSALRYAFLFLLPVFIINVFYPLPVDAELLLSLIYVSLLSGNIRSAFKKNSPWMAMGLILLLLCDLHVGIFNLADYIPALASALSGWIKNSTFLIWMFYIPAQVSLSLMSSSASIKNFKKVKSGAGGSDDLLPGKPEDTITQAF